MKPYVPYLLAVAMATALSMASAVLVQPHNYLIDDSSMVDQPDGGSLSPFYSDQSGSEHVADRDIIGIIGERLARLRWARMLDNVEESQLSPEMAELVSEDQASGPELDSMASVLLKAVSDQAAKEEQQASGAPASGSERSSGRTEQPAAAPAAPHPPAKTSSQWFNPKEVIPVLKISSMATPSKYKKVYFRSEKKLIDGAFHSPSAEEEQQENKKKKKSLLKPFGSGVQRRSSRGGGASSAAPPSPLQDGVIEFLRKFRDVYIQTRPVNTASGSSGLLSASASSPLASIFGSSGSSRPNSFANTLSAATSLVAQAAGAATGSSASSSGSSSSGTSGAASASSGSNSPLTAQSYVSFWSKTFPDWVRKTLKQLRRRSLHNSRRHQQQHQHHHSAIGQAAQAAASAVVDHATSGSSSSSSSSSSSP